MAAHQAPPSLGFSRQEHWSGLPFSSPMYESEKWKWSRSVMSDSEQPHGLQPTRLLCPWDSPGKSTVSKQQPKPEAKISLISLFLLLRLIHSKALSWDNKLQTLQIHGILWVGPSYWLRAMVLGQCWDGEKLEELLELNLFLTGLWCVWVTYDMGPCPTLLLKHFLVSWKICPKIKWKRVQMQKFKLADTAITGIIFWTQTGFVLLFYNSSLVSNGPWNIKSKSLCRYFSLSHQPVAQLVQPGDTWISTHCTFQEGERLDWGSFHTCHNGVHTFWLLPGMTVGLFLEWASILPSAAVSPPPVWAPLLPRVHSTLHWSPWRRWWSYTLSLVTCLMSRETVNSLRERWNLRIWAPSNEQVFSTQLNETCLPRLHRYLPSPQPRDRMIDVGEPSGD